MYSETDRLGRNWSLSAPVQRLAVGQPASILTPLVLLMGLLAGILTYRLVGDQLRLTGRLLQSNEDLSASQSYLQQSRADFLAIFQSMDGGAAFTTPDGFIRMTNRHYLELLHLDAAAVAGKHIDEIRQQMVVNRPGNREACFRVKLPKSIPVWFASCTAAQAAISGAS
ncbi:hypothetical protein [Deinococcus radiophilus]|uniref:hypothetical protein n=1 Tax=Deinococcus radiophilus TaxID=32062 RepID=UPI003623DFFA